jgi:hypothetical protein
MECFTIRLTQPIHRSTCTCASGMCRHILASVISLRESTPASEVIAAPAEARGADSRHALNVSNQFLAFDEDIVTKWAGKPLMKKAAIALSRGYEIEESPAAIIVRLPAQNIVVRFVAGGLDAMICTCHAPAACEHKAAAALAYRSFKSGKPVELPQAMLQASTGAPRTRDQVRESVLTLLREMIALGLSRMSIATEQRLRTLATSAHGVDFPRLERVLRGLGDEVSLALKRDAAASSASLLHAAARAAALCEALKRPTPAIVGEHRSVYMPVAGTIEVVGLGAKRWRTRSGYHGLSVFFWEPAAKRWTGWADARPVGTPGFDPVNRFGEMGPWSGAASPRHAAGMTWRLMGAFRNGAGRITSRENTRGIVGAASKPENGPLVTDFSQLSTLAADAFAPGLADRRDHADLVLLAPAAVMDATYDPVLQEVTRPIADAEGRMTPMILRHSPETDTALTTLQNIAGTTVRAVLGSLRIGPFGLFVEPITLWTDAKPIHLTLDGVSSIAKTQSSPDRQPDADDELEDPEDSEEPEIESTSAVGHLLAKLDADLLAIAESGVSVTRDLTPLRAAAKELDAAGLDTIARAARKLCDALEQFRKSIDRDELVPADALLRCAYVVRLAMECQTVSEAVGV